MSNSHGFRRYASCAALFLAAVASVATSSPIPVDQTPSLSGNDTMTLEAPEVSHHFTVHTEHDHNLSVAAKVDWGGVADTSKAEVLVRITGDGADKGDEETVFFTDFVENGKSPVVAEANAGAGIHCASSPCEKGYTVLMRLAKGAPQEPVSVQWTVTASRMGADLSGEITLEEK
jgi:hypothetical protein